MLSGSALVTEGRKRFGHDGSAAGMGVVSQGRSPVLGTGVESGGGGVASVRYDDRAVLGARSSSFSLSRATR